MTWTPKWRLPLKSGGNPHPVQTAAFIAGRERSRALIPRCQGTARSTGQKCGAMALRGARFCKNHGGLLRAQAAEAERYGKPVIIKRRVRRHALAKCGIEPPPPGFRWEPEYNRLGPIWRGKLYEAFENRVMAPDVWRETRLKAKHHVRR